jgi:hypothetical protein
MAHGVAVVTNTLGLQGIAAPKGAVARGESPEDLADACTQLLRTPGHAAEIGSSGRRFIQTTMNRDVIAREQLDRIRALPPREARR